MQKTTPIPNQPVKQEAGTTIKTGQSLFFKPAIQPKNIVNQPYDNHEREAGAMADKVMRMPGKQSMRPKFFSPRATSIQRRCDHCEAEEKKLQRKENNPGATLPPSSESYINSLSGGKALNENERNFFEPRIGYDLSKVRLHTDASADQSAKDTNALAYTTGNNIVFRTAQYQPDTDAGKKLLAHELTHVVQQGAHSGVIQKFGSDEHRLIGDSAVTSNVLITSYGKFTFGEMIAMAGDYFENIEDIATLAESYGQFGKDQIDYVLWKVNPSRTAPKVSPSVIDAVTDRYNSLAAKNETHFSTGSSPGNSNKERYIGGHIKALSQAYLEGEDPFTVRRWTWQAKEAFIQHYLTDAFSAGHVRTPRGDIKRHWDGLYPSFIGNLVSMISCYMASHINERDNVGYAKTVDGLAEDIGPIIRSKAGSVLTSFTLGDLISKVLHDADNAGLDVISAQDPSGSKKPFKWRAVGDGNLFPAAGSTATGPQQQTQDMLTAAVKLSYEEGRQAYSAGSSKDLGRLRQLIDPANFRALPLLPAEDTGSTTNETFLWKSKDINSIPANIHKLIVAAFNPGTEIRKGLDDIKVDCITTKCALDFHPCFDLHTRDAFNCFKQKLTGDIWGTMVEIAEGNSLCPPGQNDPCPKLRNACP